MHQRIENAPRRRLSRKERFEQLLDVAWKIIADEGTNSLTLGKLADAAGITKPVAYNHFGTRSGLLIELYKDFDTKQTEIIDLAIKASEPTLKGKARVIASGYIECVLTQGKMIPEVLSALEGSAKLSAVKRQYQLVFIEKCQTILAPFTPSGQVTLAGMWGILGAADALSHAAIARDISKEQAELELMGIILAIVNRS